jgi:DNA-binding transcriptional regulator YiaG
MTPKEIKKLRKNLGLSQEHFAHKLGVSVGTVCRWEGGKVKPSPLALEKLKEVGRFGRHLQGREITDVIIDDLI